MKRKKSPIIIVCILCMVLLCSCTKASVEDKISDIPQPALKETVPESVEKTEIPEVTQPKQESQIPTEAQRETLPAILTQSEVPYLIKIPRADQSIYNGPGYDYVVVRTVELAGVYTIVEEQWDGEWNLWGKLKSGAGWVDLTEIRQSEENPEPISVNYADDALLSSGNYHYFAEDTSEYAVAATFRANEMLTDVALYELYWGDAGWTVGSCLYSLGRLDPEKPLVVDMDFPGDLSCYEIRFADARGVKQSRVISMSGMDGALILSRE